ncbi:ABC transporter permease [Tabrizicola sp.]|uniref:ABC transporter permease n=1 Tax=Tabrizicola sp. TaxID=2005166 RepID=UPI001A485C08|nr:ABC transporter permease [Tabrizicola sp.]MBL9061498.1 ABC transporter permease [Tabrizicola sp.]
MDFLTWTGTAGTTLVPVLQLAVVVLALALLARFIFALAGLDGPRLPNPDGTTTGRSPGDLASLAIRYSFYAALAAILCILAAGAVMPSPVEAGILGAMAVRFWPVWLALIATFVLSIRFRRKLGLYGKLFDSTVGMIGFAIVMFWIFTAIFAGTIATYDPFSQIAGLKNDAPGVLVPDGGYGWYLLGGDHLGRDVFSRMVMGAREVLKIAPAATLFAFMVGITLGLPAGYFGGKLDTVISFLANLVLAFPVILLFYLLVTPEIRDTGIPIVLAALLFIFPIIFLCTLWNSRYYTNPPRRNLYVGITLLIGLWAYSGLAFNMDPLGIWSMEPNMLNVFVSVVFVNSPGVFRIVRGLVMDIKARDYVAAGQTRGEGAWYIMLWEILPNARGPLIVDFCLRIGYTTILLGTLGFFGLGVSPDSPDWGSTIDDGRKLLNLYPHPALAPALALMSLVLGLNLLADGLREESLKD